MAITLRTLYTNQLYQLRVSGESADVEIIRYTYATGLIASSYLPASAISILQARWNNLVSGLSAGIVNNFANLLASMLHVSDSGGELAIQYNGSGDYNYIYATGLSALSTYSINVGIPHSIETWLTGGTAVAPPI